MSLGFWEEAGEVALQCCVSNLELGHQAELLR